MQNQMKPHSFLFEHLQCDPGLSMNDETSNSPTMKLRTRLDLFKIISEIKSHTNNTDSVTQHTQTQWPSWPKFPHSFIKTLNIKSWKSQTRF
jgi:hypothetical protein